MKGIDEEVSQHGNSMTFYSPVNVNDNHWVLVVVEVVRTVVDFSTTTTTSSSSSCCTSSSTGTVFCVDPLAPCRENSLSEDSRCDGGKLKACLAVAR